MKIYWMFLSQLPTTILNRGTQSDFDLSLVTLTLGQGHSKSVCLSTCLHFGSYWKQGWWWWWWQLQHVQSSSRMITTNKPPTPNLC